MSVDRITRLNALLQRELGQLVVTYVAPEMPGVLITITGVRVASNLRSATVFFSVYGTDAEDQSEKVLALLQKKRALLQSPLPQRLMKYTQFCASSMMPPSTCRPHGILAELQLSEQDSEHNV